MQGRLSEFSVADLLQLYQIAGKSGRLIVGNGHRLHTFYFDRGLVSGAGADHWRLTAELSRVEVLDPEVRQQLELVGTDDSQVGLSPIARALLSPAVWDQFVELQIEQLIYPPLGWQQGEFDARVDPLPDIAPLRVKQAPQQLILNAARWEEELRRAEADGIDRESWWRLANPEAADSDQDPLLALLAQPRSLVDLARAAGVSRLNVIERVRSLAALGLLEQYRPMLPKIEAGA